MAKTSRQPHPEASAREAGLVYINEGGPGIRRVGNSIKSFSYVDSRDSVIRDDKTLGRIKRLAIPPAWTEVWICPLENGHLQATGRDAKGRKQYRYHSHWRQTRDETKYNKMIQFARALPTIRAVVRTHLAMKGLPREKVLATVVRLLETGSIRVGNDEYARTNNSYGITTLQDRHAQITRGSVRFKFRGKSGKDHVIEIADPILARIVKGCQSLPGQELFQYKDARGKVRDINSTDVNQYLKEISGADFTAKDFRTWAGTVLAAIALAEFEKYETKKRAQKNIKEAVERVAKTLGNTPAICRKCYVHPAVLEAYLDGNVIKTFQNRTEQLLTRVSPELQPEETAVLQVLKRALNAKKREQETTLAERLSASLAHRGPKVQGGVGGRGIPAAAAASSCKRRCK